MTPRQIIGLGLRVAGIAIALVTCRNALQFMATLGAAPIVWTVLQLVGFGLAFISSLAMVVFPLTIAAKIYPGPADNKLETQWSLQEAQIVAVSFLGLWLIIQTALDATAWFAYWSNLKAQYVESTLGSPPVAPETAASVSAAVVQGLIGLLLLLRPSRIVQVLALLRDR